MSDTDEDGPVPVARRVERSFTCTRCGYGTSHEVTRLRTETQATCLNCGDWTVQSAAVDAVVDEARAVADELSGAILSERQALAFLLREHVGLGRRDAAEAMGSSPSNVDNLQRRGREKVAAARTLVGALDALGSGDGTRDEREY